MAKSVVRLLYFKNMSKILNVNKTPEFILKNLYLMAGIFKILKKKLVLTVFCELCNMLTSIDNFS